jgi:thiamine biosynthesis protein ThiS
MNLQINGEPHALADAEAGFTLAALIESLNMKPDRVAVELNREIVPRDRWPQTQLKEGDRLEIVHFVGGGTASATPGVPASPQVHRIQTNQAPSVLTLQNMPAIRLG